MKLQIEALSIFTNRSDILEAYVPMKSSGRRVCNSKVPLMLDIHNYGSVSFCDQLSRRDALQVGGLGTMGLGLPALLQSQVAAKSSGAASSSSNSFGRAKRVIMLFMWGGPAHQDTWDLKPDGPVETRGEFLPIATNVPGIHISEHFPRIARHADKLAIIRSVGQEDNRHSTGAHAGLTGRRHERSAENFGARDSDFPHYGSVLSKLRPNVGGLPTFVALPEVIATTAGAITPGQGGGLLGKKFDPFQITDHPDREDFSIASLTLPAGVADRRMHSRQSLLRQVDGVSRLADRASNVQAMDSFYQQAMGMVLSSETRRAFDLSAVEEAERWRYGWHTFGQSTLLARRLIEAGVQLVTIYWHREKRSVDSTWDTHAVNFTALKQRLMPSVDRPIAALLEDLDRSGLLDETLVIWNSEFGRTPRINGNAGRDHWGPCNSVVMAGGGVPGGQVYGSSDAQAAHPASNKVTQDDIAATIYHLLGIEPETPVYNRLKRPYPVALGEPIHELLGGQSRPEPKPNPTTVRVRRIGAFTRLLMERGNRHLSCDFGNPDSEAEWKLQGWSQPVGAGVDRHRTIAGEAATVTYTGKFYSHFDYAYAVIRSATPRTIDGLGLALNGRPLPIPEDLTTAAPSTVWQIPFPAGMIRATKTLAMSVTAPGWQITDFAAVGEQIRERHLRHFEV